MKGNIWASADHCFKLVSGEEREERNRNDPRHSLPDASDDGVELVKPEVERQFDILRSVFGGDAGIS